MAACLFQHRWGRDGCSVSLIESSSIPIVGVGEGSTPQLKAFFDEIGVAESEWMPACHATYKVGIRFEGWSERPGFESYFHPFATALDMHTGSDLIGNCWLRRGGVDVHAHPDRFFVPARLADENRAPLPDPDFPFLTTYGYHFDATFVGAFLRGVAVDRGITHIDAKVVEVSLTEDGSVGALRAEDGRQFEADLYVDASGFRGLVIQEALREPHLSFGSNLFNDRAVVAPTPLPKSGPGVCTTSTALNAGWVWNIPLTNRTGNGYVYSSRYLDADAAEKEFRAHLALAGTDDVRHLEMKVGRVERTWVRNCLAIGLAQGFIEPLEATALHIVLSTIDGFMKRVDRIGDSDEARRDFNDDIAGRYEGIRDYIVCHYRAAPRGGSDYWRHATRHDELSDSLKQLFTAWFTGADMVEEITRQDISRYYPVLSWHCLFGGYGNYPQKLQPAPAGIESADLGRIDHFVAACSSHYPAHVDALARLGN